MKRSARWNRNASVICCGLTARFPSMASRPLGPISARSLANTFDRVIVASDRSRGPLAGRLTSGNDVLTCLFNEHDLARCQTGPGGNGFAGPAIERAQQAQALLLSLARAPSVVLLA